MLCSFVTDVIVVKVQCGECLCEIKRMRVWLKRYGCYIVLWESIGKALYSFKINLMVANLQCVECLYEALR